jgi:hypothetical protein
MEQWWNDTDWERLKYWETGDVATAGEPCGSQGQPCGRQGQQRALKGFYLNKQIWLYALKKF